MFIYYVDNFNINYPINVLKLIQLLLKKLNLQEANVVSYSF